MRQALWIALKDVRVALRDRAGLLVMLAAPLALTFVFVFAFGGQGGGGLAQIDLLVVNQDKGELGAALLDLLGAAELSDLLAPVAASDPAAARAQVDADKVAAAIIIPAGLSEAVLQGDGSTTTIEIYTNPARPISSGVVSGVVQRFTESVNAGAAGAQVAVSQLVETGRLDPSRIAAAAPELGFRAAVAAGERTLLVVDEITIGGDDSDGFNFLGYYASSMAVLFLMFTMNSAARTILEEQREGTFDRLRSTPAAATSLIGGKMAGTYLIGLLQMVLLILATRLLLGVDWGALAGLGLHVLLVVGAMAALGTLLAALARDEGQANALGTAVVLVLAITSGNFLPRPAYPDWLQQLSLIGPSAWGIEGFQKLAAGAGIPALGPEITALAAMTVIFFAAATIGMRRQLR